MAHVEKRGPSRWRARYIAPDGRERSRTFPRKVDAERFLATVEADKLRGAYVDPAAGRVTFGQYAEQWRRIQTHRATTAAYVESQLRNHVLPTFGGRQLGSVRTSEVQAWVRDVGNRLAPSTVEITYRYLSAIFRAAVQDRLIAVSPCVGITLPRQTPKRVKPLTTEAVHALIDAVSERYRALIVTAAGTGLRQGEAFGLELRHVDFLRRTLRVEQQLVLLPGGPPYIAPPKTDASFRVIPLPQVVIDALAAHLAMSVPGDNGLIFTGMTGQGLRRTNFNAAVWQPAVRRAGLPAGTTFHALRHYYASLLIRHGESVKVVQARLGHASAAETLDTYSHLWPDSEDLTRAAVDGVLGEALTASPRPGESAEG